MVSYTTDIDIYYKLNSYVKNTGILENIFKPQKSLIKYRLMLYNVFALPTSLYTPECWKIKGKTYKCYATE